jgi:hypothetical protein
MKKLVIGFGLMIAASVPVISFAQPEGDDRVVINAAGEYPDSDVTIPAGQEGPVFIGGAPIFGDLFTLNIFLTEKGSNIISDHLYSGGDGNRACELAGVRTGTGDCIFFASDPSADPFIGTPCLQGPNFCLAETGELQDVTFMVAAQNGGLGIFGGGSILVQSDIPEPATLALLGLGLAGLGFSRRKQ